MNPTDSEALVELLRTWSHFRRETPNGGLTQFGTWLAENVAPQAVAPPPDGSVSPTNFELLTPNSQLPTQQAGPFYAPFPPAAQAGILVGRLNRFARLYFRKAVEVQEGVSLDDFGLMQGILMLGRPRVSDLLHLNMMEATTGSAALKRLIAHGWVAEEPNPQDGRSKLLSLTPEGTALVFRGSALLGQIGELFVGPLPPEALNGVVVALRQLDEWHTAHHETLPADLPFEEMRVRMLETVSRVQDANG